MGHSIEGAEGGSRLRGGSGRGKPCWRAVPVGGEAIVTDFDGVVR
jgi:hypothetical protein